MFYRRLLSSWTDCECEDTQTTWYYPCQTPRTNHTTINERVINRGRCARHEAEWLLDQEYHAVGHYLYAAEFYQFCQALLTSRREARGETIRRIHEQALWSSNRSLIIIYFFLLAWYLSPLLSIGFNVWLPVVLSLWAASVIFIYFLVEELSHAALRDLNPVAHTPLLLLVAGLTLYCLPCSLRGLVLAIFILSTTFILWAWNAGIPEKILLFLVQTKNRLFSMVQHGRQQYQARQGETTGFHSPILAEVGMPIPPTNFPFLDHCPEIRRETLPNQRPPW